MKTLILNGSAKKNGDISALINELKNHLDGDVRIISSYFDNISPCIDCRRCWSTYGCAIQDDMQEVYRYLEICDNLVIASPVWFSELSGPLLNTASRFQTYFAARFFRNESVIPKHKNGVLLLVGAEDGTQTKASSTANTIFKHANALPCVASIFSMNTNTIPAKDDAFAIDCVRNAAILLNQLYCDKS